jgi:hypothetical protein
VSDETTSETRPTDPAPEERAEQPQGDGAQRDESGAWRHPPIAEGDNLAAEPRPDHVVDGARVALGLDGQAPKPKGKRKRERVVCPWCGEGRELQQLVAGDVAGERRIDAHGEPVGTCEGSNATVSAIAAEVERLRLVAEAGGLEPESDSPEEIAAAEAREMRRREAGRLTVPVEPGAASTTPERSAAERAEAARVQAAYAERDAAALNPPEVNLRVRELAPGIDRVTAPGPFSGGHQTVELPKGGPWDGALAIPRGGEGACAIEVGIVDTPHGQSALLEVKGRFAFCASVDLLLTRRDA